MPLLTINNLTTSPLTVVDPTGLYPGTYYLVPASGSVTNKSLSLQALAAIELLLAAEETAGRITWSVANDPTTGLDPVPDHIQTVLVTPYNAVAGDQDIIVHLTTPGASSVVLSAAAAIGQRVRVIDGAANAGTDNITITVAGGGTINGGSSLVINTNSGQASLLKTGSTAWLATSGGTSVVVPVAITSGTATLGAGGTVTVSTANITASSKIQVTRNTPAGTVGNLSVPSASRVTGTPGHFVINSDSSSETSTVDWTVIG